MNLSKKIFAYIKITRPLNVLITYLVVVVAIFISEKEQTELIVLILAPLAAALTAAAGNIVNDIYDIETDRISHPNRILVLGSLSIKEAWIEYWILNSLSVFLAIYLSPILLIIVVPTIFMLYIYSAFLKRLPLIGNVIIASITALAFIYGGYAVANPNAAIIPAVFAFLINLIREIIKDIQDIEGDLKLNFKTFPIRLGIDKSKHIIVLFAITLILFTLYPFMQQIYKIEYFILVMVFVNPVLVICIKILLDKRRQTNLKMISRLLKLNMLVGLVAIYLGK